VLEVSLLAVPILYRVSGIDGQQRLKWNGFLYLTAFATVVNLITSWIAFLLQELGDGQAASQAGGVVLAFSVQ
jgi:hypothetical protein